MSGCAPRIARRCQLSSGTTAVCWMRSSRRITATGVTVVTDAAPIWMTPKFRTVGKFARN